MLPNTDPLDKVTIIRRGLSLGATEQLPEEERYNLDEVRSLVGGLEQQATKLLKQHRPQLDALPNALREKEILKAPEIHEILDRAGKQAVETA